MFFIIKQIRIYFQKKREVGPCPLFLFDPIVDADLCKNRLLRCGSSLFLLRKLTDYKGKNTQGDCVSVCPLRS